MQNNVGTGLVLLALGQGIAVSPVGLPHPGLVAAVGFGEDGDMVGHHKSGVEAHAELADHIDLLGSLIIGGQVGLELAGAAVGDGAQITLQILLCHAHAVIRDGQGTHLLVGDNGDLQVAPLHVHPLIGQGLIGQLVLRVAGIGDELTQEDFLVGIDGIDHHIQQPLGLRLELFLCHGTCLHI